MRERKERKEMERREGREIHYASVTHRPSYDKIVEIEFDGTCIGVWNSWTLYASVLWIEASLVYYELSRTPQVASN